MGGYVVPRCVVRDHSTLRVNQHDPLIFYIYRFVYLVGAGSTAYHIYNIKEYISKNIYKNVYKYIYNLFFNPLVRLTVAYIQREVRWARWRHQYRIVSDTTIIK